LIGAHVFYCFSSKQKHIEQLKLRYPELKVSATMTMMEKLMGIFRTTREMKNRHPSIPPHPTNFYLIF